MIKQFILIYCMILSTCCFGQKFDRVNIYAIPVETSFAVDNVDANYIRVKHTYTFSSIDKNYIENIAKYFLTNLDDLPSYNYEETVSGIRIVIDFIQNEEIKSFVLINSGFMFYISNWKTMKRSTYQLHGDEICEINKIIPFFNMLTIHHCN